MSDSDTATTFIDYYKLFEIEPSASMKIIRSKYIVLAKQLHPDMGGSTEAMQLLNKAYRTLADTTARTAYDMLHRLHTEQAGEVVYQYSAGPESSGHIVNDDYVDLFIDQVYNELTAATPQKKKITLFSRIFGAK